MTLYLKTHSAVVGPADGYPMRRHGAPKGRALIDFLALHFVKAA